MQLAVRVDTAVPPLAVGPTSVIVSACGAGDVRVGVVAEHGDVDGLGRVGRCLVVAALGAAFVTVTVTVAEAVPPRPSEIE